MNCRVLTTADISEIELAVPPGHRHVRGVLRLRSGEEFVLQEATLAALVRGFVTVKTHPEKLRVKMVGQDMAGAQKEGFASWQLLEEGGRPEG